MARRLLLAVLMLAASVALLGVGALAAHAGEGPKGGTIRLSAPADVDFVDPALAYFPHSWMIGYATCAKLFNYPDATGAAGTRFVPEVVDRTNVSRDRRTYTFHLKRSFRFHTGARVTAQSFADAFNRNAQPKLASPAIAYMHEIVGADAVIDGKAETISGVRVLGSHSLQIRLRRPLGDFTARLTMPFFCPILPNTRIDPDGIDDPAGSGPYYVHERVPNQRIVLRRNPYYRGDRPANVDQVVVTIDTTEACLLEIEEDALDYCYLGGGLDGGRSLRALVEKHGLNRAGGQFFVSPSLTTHFVAFDHDRPAFKGPGQIPLKRAINYAIDRPALARTFGYLSAKRTDQMLPPALARSESIYPRVGADYATARKLLARATRQPTELVLYANSFPSGVAQAQVLVFNLEQIGIDVEVKYFDIGVMPEKIATRGEPFDLALTGWAADYADPASFFIPLLARGSGAGGVYLDDPRVNRRTEAANRLSGDARRKAWADLDVDLMRDNPSWAPYVHTQTRTFVSRSVGCVLNHPVYGFDIAAVCKK
jgi:ABC-type oligopeptide transport system substrate-binding subunit